MNSDISSVILLSAAEGWMECSICDCQEFKVLTQASVHTGKTKATGLKCFGCGKVRLITDFNNLQGEFIPGD